MVEKQGYGTHHNIIPSIMTETLTTCVAHERLARDVDACRDDEYIRTYMTLDQISPTTILVSMKFNTENDKWMQFALVYDDYPWQGPNVFCLDSAMVRSRHFQGSIVMDGGDWDCWSPAAKVRQVLLMLHGMMHDLVV